MNLGCDASRRGKMLCCQMFLYNYSSILSMLLHHKTKKDIKKYCKLWICSTK